MPRQSEGSVITRSDRPGLWARVTYSDSQGKRRVIQRRVPTRTEGKQLLKQLLREIEDHGIKILEGDRLTFRDLAKVYEEKRLFPPTITTSGRAKGLKSYKSARRRLKTLASYFGPKRIRNISHDDVEAYKDTRLAIPPARFIVRRDKLQSKIASLKARRGKKGDERLVQISQLETELESLQLQLADGKLSRSEADVNRDLQLLRNVFNFAIRKGWLTQNPFALGEPLISLAVEVQRDRILSREEEERLLMACDGPRSHLRQIIICALDTAMRRGEILHLRWEQVDLDGGQINVLATNSKTGRARAVPITSRLCEELIRLKTIAPIGFDERVFGVSDIKKGFTSACEIAGVEDFRLHDARHTAITRLIEQGLPPMQVMDISGHTQMSTFARYVNADKTALRRAAEAMNDWHEQGFPLKK
jgi:integrase